MLTKQPPPTQAQTASHTLYTTLLGGAVGDALGLPFEGLSSKRVDKLFKNHTAYNLIPLIQGGMVSDDTEHAIMTVQAFIWAKSKSNGDTQLFYRLFRKRLRHHLRLWLLGLPAGIGMATGRALFKLWLFLPNSGVFSAGNGGAMRSAVLGVMADGLDLNLDELKQLVAISTQITHTDPKATQGALVVALSAWYSKNHKEVKPQDLLNFLLENIEDDELKGYLQTVYQAAQTDKTLSEVMGEMFGKNNKKKKRAVDEMKKRDKESERRCINNTSSELDTVPQIQSVHYVSGYMYHTIPAVMFSYFRYPDNPMRGLQTLINAGGDVDTTCAIAGGIWGVKHGQAMYDIVQGRWLEPKITPNFIQKLAEQSEKENPKSVRFGGLVTLVRNLVFLGVVLLHGFRRLLPPY